MQSTLENKKKIEKSFIPNFIDNPHHSSQYISTVSLFWVVFLSHPKEFKTACVQVYAFKMSYINKYCINIAGSV